MNDKSPDAYRTISEVAEDLDLPQHVLRFWETRFPQIKPLKRGGGRRYYRPDDVALIIGLKTLLYGQGFTIKGVQRILKEQGVRHVQAIGRGQSSAPAAGAGPAEDKVAAVPVAVPGPASAPAPPVTSVPRATLSSQPSFGVFQPSAGAPVRMQIESALTELVAARRALHRALEIEG